MRAHAVLGLLFTACGGTADPWSTGGMQDLVEEREENLWNAYNSGAVRDGRWTHMFMSDGEWLARQCGFDSREADYDDAEIRAAIPKAALSSVGGE